MKELFKRYKEIVAYIFFGAMTTVINTVLYIFLYQLCEMNNLLSNLLAWFFAVVFAFITNKIWVFESRDFSMRTFINESIKFFGCRIGTGILDMLIMLIGVDILRGNALICKLFSNIIVIICNYFASKLFIFKRSRLL